MSEVPLLGPEGPAFSATAKKAAFTDGMATVTPITDALSSSEYPRGPQRLDIRNPRDVKIAAQILVDGQAPLFARFGNILGVFGHPEAVEDINEFKGRPRNKTGSVTTTPEHYESLADWDRLDTGLLVPGSDVRLDKDTVLTLIHALSKDGPVGALLPAADHIPSLLSLEEERRDGKLRTVQLIVPGKDCPSTEVFAMAVAQMPEMPIIFATSGNMSKTVMKTEQPAHYRYQPLVEEFGEQGKGDITVITDTDNHERTLGRRHQFHDQRSTTILRLEDVVRNDEGAPVLDANNRPVLRVQRHGSMHAGYLQKVLGEHGFGAEFPPKEQRVPIRTDTTGDKVRQRTHELVSGVLVRFGNSK